MKLRTSGLLSLVLLVILSVFTSCSQDKGVTTGKLGVSLTDAPLEVGNVEGVYITVIGAEVNGPKGWKALPALEKPVEINLLDYQNGKSYFLTEAELPIGEYNEIRLLLDIPEQGKTPKANPGCFLKFTDGSTQPLFVPSGAQSGYKIKGKFDIIPGGLTNITLDFDVRKAVVEAANSGKYLLKPTLRLIVDNVSGYIDGTVTYQASDISIVVFAYNDSTYKDTEALAPTEGNVRFPNAVSSAVVDPATGKFSLAFLEPVTYDLVFAAYDANGEFIEVIGSTENVVVQSRLRTTITASFTK